MHADDARESRVALRVAVRHDRRVIRAVQRRADVVAHAAVDRDVRARGDGRAIGVCGVAAEFDRLDGADAVERHTGRRHDPTARFE